MVKIAEFVFTFPVWVQTHLPPEFLPVRCLPVELLPIDKSLKRFPPWIFAHWMIAYEVHAYGKLPVDKFQENFTHHIFACWQLPVRHLAVEHCRLRVAAQGKRVRCCCSTGDFTSKSLRGNSQPAILNRQISYRQICNMQKSDGIDLLGKTPW